MVSVTLSSHLLFACEIYVLNCCLLLFNFILSSSCFPFTGMHRRNTGLAEYICYLLKCTHSVVIFACWMFYGSVDEMITESAEQVLWQNLWQNICECQFEKKKNYNNFVNLFNVVWTLISLLHSIALLTK